MREDIKEGDRGQTCEKCKGDMNAIIYDDFYIFHGDKYNEPTLELFFRCFKCDESALRRCFLLEDNDPLPSNKCEKCGSMITFLRERCELIEFCAQCHGDSVFKELFGNQFTNPLG